MATAKQQTPDHPILGRVKEEVGKFVSARIDDMASKAGDKLTDLTGALTDSAENGSPLKIGSRILKGDSPVSAAAGETMNKVKDKVPGLSSGDKGEKQSGGSKDGPGDVKATSIVEAVEVGVPLRTAYDHWTQYDKFDEFTKGVRSVSKDDDITSDWKMKIGPSMRSWKATVVEQLPDDRIVWKTEGPKGTTHGVVSFHELAPTLTRVVLVVEYYPSGFLEKTGNLWRAQGRRMRLDLKHFQRYVTFSTEDAEGWRGEIREGEIVRSHEDATADEDGDEDGGEEPEDDEYEDSEDGEADEADEDDEDDEDDDED
jgi:uncharacterized membrane protein